VRDSRRILLVTFYYQPDLSAGSFRTAALVNALLEHESPRVAVDVLTTLPHRYQSYTRQASEQHVDGRVSIRRIKLPAHKSGMVDQARSFGVFAREASKLRGSPKYDLVVGTSGRLMTAALSASIAARLGAPLYLDIRDLFVDNIKYILPKPAALGLYPVFSLLEKWTFNRAIHINLVSRGFTPYFEARYPGKPLSHFTNGVDDEFYPEHAPAAIARGRDGVVHVLYAGNLGEAQGLHVTIPPLARRLAGRVRFTLIGDGGRRAQLQEALTTAGVDNVRIVPPMPRDALIAEYREADVLFLQLNDYAAFKTVLPSKIFEYAALGKPIWAGVAGHPADFLREEVSNVAVFPPCDVDEALAAFERLQIRDVPRASFIEKYSRRTIMRAMAADIVAHADRG
jgi:glycosyl transferase family 1